MKKTYLKPNSEIINIETTELMAASLGGDEQPWVNFEDAEDASGQSADSRGFSIWSTDEE